MCICSTGWARGFRRMARWRCEREKLRISPLPLEGRGDRTKPSAMTTTTTNRITRADQSANPYFSIPCYVPAGTTRIEVTLAYAKAEDCVIDLGAFDPRETGYPTEDGFRGWSGGARDRFFIATDDA